MKIYNVADLPYEECPSCVECRKRFDDDKCMKKIVFEYKNGKHTCTHPIYLCSECYEDFFELMCDTDIDESMVKTEAVMERVFNQKE